MQVRERGVGRGRSTSATLLEKLCLQSLVFTVLQVRAGTPLPARHFPPERRPAALSAHRRWGELLNSHMSSLTRNCYQRSKLHCKHRGGGTRPPHTPLSKPPVRSDWWTPALAVRHLIGCRLLLNLGVNAAQARSGEAEPHTTAQAGLRGNFLNSSWGSEVSLCRGVSHH